MKRILEFVQGPQNEYSSKRLFGLVSFANAIALSWTGGSPQLVAVFMGAATGVFVAQAASGT
jgi:hypothetical protein